MRQSVRLLLGAVSLCTIAACPAAAAEAPPGGIRLLPGYTHNPLQGIDSIVGELVKDGGLKISYEIGHVSKPGEPMVGGGFRDRPKLTPKEKLRWYREQTVNGQPVHVAFTKDNTLLVSFPNKGMNFRTMVRSSEDFADAMLMMMTCPGPAAAEATQPAPDAGESSSDPGDAGQAVEKPAPGSDDARKRTEVTLTPTQPYLLPDRSTKLSIKKETSWENRVRGGFPQLTRKDLTLDIVPNTVIASGGYLFHLTVPHDYKFGEVREADMIFTVVDSCKSWVLSEKRKAPRVQLKALKGSLPFDANHRSCNQLGSVRGEGKHFVALKISSTEIYRKHPSPVLGTGMDVTVVNNFGAKSIRLEYMQKETVTIGPETITVESVNFDFPSKSVEINVSTEPKAAEAEALIVEYGNKAGDAAPGQDVEIKEDGKWKPVSLPLAALALGKAAEVKVRGKLTHGIMAIGGETTGTIVRIGKTTWELDLQKAPGFRAAAEKLNGKRVVVTGTVRTKAGVEIAKRTILTVESIDATDD